MCDIKIIFIKLGTKFQPACHGLVCTVEAAFPDEAAFPEI